MSEQSSIQIRDNVAEVYLVPPVFFRYSTVQYSSDLADEKNAILLVTAGKLSQILAKNGHVGLLGGF